MAIVRMSTKGQIVIPAELRQQLGLKAGTYIRVERDGADLVLKPLGEDLVEALCGMFARDGGPSLTEELLAERRRELEREEAKMARWGGKVRLPEAIK